jgi:rhodanese-related sulfurtransferase
MTFIRCFFVAVAVIFGLASPATAQDAPMHINGAITVNAREIFDLVSKTRNLVILDNRKEEDYAAGHLDGAIRLIDTDVSTETLAKHIPDKNSPVLFYCNGIKCGRAAKATEKAIELGYTEVYYYALGMDEWHKMELPVTR